MSRALLPKKTWQNLRVSFRKPFPMTKTFNSPCLPRSRKAENSEAEQWTNPCANGEQLWPKHFSTLWIALRWGGITYRFLEWRLSIRGFCRNVLLRMEIRMQYFFAACLLGEKG